MWCACVDAYGCRVSKMNWGTISAEVAGFFARTKYNGIFSRPDGGRIIATKEGQEGQGHCRPTFGEWQRPWPFRVMVAVPRSWKYGEAARQIASVLRCIRVIGTDPNFSLSCRCRSTIGMPIMYYDTEQHLRTSRDSRPAIRVRWARMRFKTLEDGDLLRTDRVSSSRVVGHANRRMSSAKRSRRWLSRGPTPTIWHLINPVGRADSASPESVPPEKGRAGKFSGD